MAMTTTYEDVEVMADAALKDSDRDSWNTDSRKEALQYIFAEFVFITHCNAVTDTISLTEDDVDIDTSSMAGFSSERMTRARIGYKSLREDGYADILSQLDSDTGTGEPTRIAFDDDGVTGLIYPISDDDYTLTLHYYKPLVTYSTQSTVINIPDEYIRPIVFKALHTVLLATGEEDYHLSRDWLGFVAWCEDIADKKAAGIIMTDGDLLME